MKEILFRGKSTDNGEWVEGYLIQKGGETLIARSPYCTGKLHETSWLEFCFGGFIEVIPETVGQYTGLTDKNGKKIFDGDIIKAAGATPEYNLIVIRDEGYGFFNDYYFAGEKHDTEQISGADWFLCDEVIGNIHDNTELLEVTK